MAVVHYTLARAWHDACVSIAIVLVAVVIIAGVVVVAMGGGGELVRDLPGEPADSDFESWTAVARYRPPAALLGYHAAATERALQRIARVLADRDAEIAWLRSKLEQAEPGAAEHPDIGASGPDVPQQPGALEAQELGAHELGAQELGAQELGAQELGAQELGAQELGGAPQLGAQQLGAQQLGAQQPVPPPSVPQQPVAPESAQSADPPAQSAYPPAQSADPLAQASQATIARDEG
jgi:hypothetical protein